MFSKSSIFFVALCSIIILFRCSHINNKEIAWDVLGYYLYLPATFVHHDPMLSDISWLKELNDKNQLTGTLYQVSSNQKGEPMYFFLMGMAFFYLPFFGLAYVIAMFTGYPPDGFSLPFQYSLVMGGIVYTIIGLYFFRKILKSFFNDWITSIVLIVIVLGTNYIHHLTLDNLATVNVLFMLSSILIWNTIQWHHHYKNYNLIIIGCCVLMMGMVKPSEIVIILLPLLWNVYSIESLKRKMELILNYKKLIIYIVLLCIILALPQLMYWYAKTGKIIYDSYKNPGVGLDVFSPHILNVLFSYRKGWLLYTPIMTFSLVGFYYLYRENKNIFWSILIYFAVSFYIIASWSEWWYGAAYSGRPMITLYPVLGICLGYFLSTLISRRKIFQYIFGTLVLGLILLNQFQWWQFRNYLLDPYRMTQKAYWSNFLKTKPDPDYGKYLLVERDFTGAFNFKNKEDYLKNTVSFWDFDGESGENIYKDTTGNYYYKMGWDQEFSKTYQRKYFQLTEKDHIWVELTVDIKMSADSFDIAPLMVISVEHKGGIYGYHTVEFKKELMDGTWHKLKLNYLSPEMRSKSDILKCYIWKRGKHGFEFDNLRVDVFEHK